MLQAIRERAQGWIAWVIVILITIPFALWGIQEYLGIGGEKKAVSVNDRDITEREFDSAFQRYRLQLREQLGDAYKAGIIDDQLLKNQVLSSMIRSELLVQAAQDRHMEVSDNMVRTTIASIPAFQKAGKFDYPSYERNLRQQGMTPDMFVQRMRGSMVIEQLTQAIRESEFTTKRELKDAVRLSNQKREVSYLRYARANYPYQGAFDEAAVSSYYESHKADYRVPERVKIEYVELSIPALAKQLKVDDEKLQAYLDTKADDYRLPEERRASHILVTVKEGKESEAREKAEGLLAKLKGGEDFAAVAKAESEDPGSAGLGGDLGFFSRGVMDETFENAAFSLKPEELSDVVRSQFGFHIIKLQQVRGGGKAQLKDVRERVLTAYATEEAQRLFYEQAERLADLAYETPNSLEPIVEQLGLKAKTSDWITRAGGEGDLKSPKVVAAAFREDVLDRGNNSEPVELSQEHILILRVAAHEQTAAKPLADVKEQIVAALKDEKSKQAAISAGSDAIAKLRGGESLSAVAQASGAKLEAPGLVARNDGKVPAAVIQKAFKLARPGEGKPSIGGAELADGDYAVVVVSKIEDGKAEKEQQAKAAVLARIRGDRYEDLYVSALERQAEILYHNKPKSGAE